MDMLSCYLTLRGQYMRSFSFWIYMGCTYLLSVLGTFFIRLIVYISTTQIDLFYLMYNNIRFWTAERERAQSLITHTHTHTGKYTGSDEFTGPSTSGTLVTSHSWAEPAPHVGTCTLRPSACHVFTHSWMFNLCRNSRVDVRLGPVRGPKQTRPQWATRGSMAALRAAKQALRKEIKRRVSALSAEEKRRQSVVVSQQVREPRRLLALLAISGQLT